VHTFSLMPTPYVVKPLLDVVPGLMDPELAVPRLTPAVRLVLNFRNDDSIDRGLPLSHHAGFR